MALAIASATKIDNLFFSTTAVAAAATVCSF
jgi:hypothetical protein